jgi:hypothetical protein
MEASVLQISGRYLAFFFRCSTSIGHWCGEFHFFTRIAARIQVLTGCGGCGIKPGDEEVKRRLVIAATVDVAIIQRLRLCCCAALPSEAMYHAAASRSPSRLRSREGGGRGRVDGGLARLPPRRRAS